MSCYQLWVPKVQLKMSENDFLPHEGWGGGGGGAGGGMEGERKKQRGEKSKTETITEK